MNQLFVRGLTVLDFSYLHDTRGMVGESWIVDIELSGELDAQGMVFDFSDVKKRIRAAVEQHADHKLIVPRQSPSLVKFDAKDGQVTLAWEYPRGTITHSSPATAVTLIESDQVTPAALVSTIRETVLAALPANVTGFELTLREEEIDGPYYHYSHGLKKHAGQCQRIAHGHRSRIEIHRNGKRDLKLENQWARRWQDIYIGTGEDVCERGQGEQPTLKFHYRASEGAFSLELPESQVYLIDTDSTVEWIASHIAEQCKASDPEGHYRVRAYEGVDKGAIAER